MKTIFELGEKDHALTLLPECDVPVVMLSTMVIAAVTLAASCLVDILTAALDPRVRLN